MAPTTNSPLLQLLTLQRLPPLPGGSAPPAGRSPLPGLRVGQSVIATVERQLAPQRIEVSIGGQRLEAATGGGRFPPGARMELVLESQGNQPILRVATREDGGGAITRQALRARLPAQLPVRDAFALIQTARSRVSGTAGDGAVSARDGVGRLLASAPTPAQLANPASLRAVVRGSGLFLESLLRRSVESGREEAPGRDLKAQLLRAAAGLENKPDATGARPASTRVGPEPAGRTDAPASDGPAMPSDPGAERLGILRSIRGAVSRLEIHQLAASPTGETTAGRSPGWTMEIPVNIDGDFGAVRLDVQERAGRPGDAPGAESWSVRFDVELPGEGVVHGTVGIAAEAVTTTFWSEPAALVDRLEHHLDELRADLEAHGLEVGALRCLAGGAPPADLGDLISGLLNVHA